MNPLTEHYREQPAGVVIVDDDPVICEMLTHALSAKHYRIRSASSCEDALVKIKGDPPELVIVDIKIRGPMNGLDFLKRAKTYVSDVAAIVITGSPDLDTTVQSMRLGVFDYLAKPFDLNQILEAVERALENQRRNRRQAAAEEVSRLQSELLLHMSHEFKSAVETIDHQSKNLLHLIDGILDLPKRSYARMPGNPLEWQDIMHRLARSTTPTSKANVLVVDDDPSIVQLIDYMLTKEGYAVESAYDGKAALEKLAAHKPDFMILDLMMPKLNGFEVLDTISKIPELKDLPVVVLSARYLTSAEQQTLQKRVERIVQKGQSDIDEILAVLHERYTSFRSLSAA